MLTTVLPLPAELDESIDEASPWSTTEEEIESRDLAKYCVGVASKAYDILAHWDLMSPPFSFIRVIFRNSFEVRCVIHHFETSDRT